MYEGIRVGEPQPMIAMDVLGGREEGGMVEARRRRNSWQLPQKKWRMKIRRVVRWVGGVVV